MAVEHMFACLPWSTERLRNILSVTSNLITHQPTTGVKDKASGPWAFGLFSVAPVRASAFGRSRPGTPEVGACAPTRAHPCLPVVDGGRIKFKEVTEMTANIPTAIRKAVYRRDGWRCALCDSTTTIQIHHYIPRGQGGGNNPMNLITLCSACHSLAHGVPLWDEEITAEEINQAITEYLADTYVDAWNPFQR